MDKQEKINVLEERRTELVNKLAEIKSLNLPSDKEQQEVEDELEAITNKIVILSK